MSATAITPSSARSGHPGYILAWAFCLLFYFGQYALRSAPGVMMPELETTFGLTALGVSSLVGLYYYTYSTFAIIAGASLDRFGAKYVVPVGILLTAIGAILFGLGSSAGACCRARDRPLPSPARSISPAMDLPRATWRPQLGSPNASACWAGQPDSLLSVR
jgi:MFS family permease